MKIVFNASSRAVRVLLVSLGVAMVLALAVGLRPAYRGVKVWRAHRLVLQGERAYQSRQWDEALAKGQAAMQLSPGDPVCVRFLARLLTAAGSDQALGFWEVLVDGPDARASDREAMIGLALDLRRLEVAERRITEALRGGATNAAIYRMSAVLSEFKGDTEVAIRFARAALGQQPEDAQVRMLLARQLLTTREVRSRIEAKDLLFALGDRKDVFGADALAYLAQRGELLRPEAARCLEMLEGHPARTNRHDLVLADLQVRLRPSDRETVLSAVVKRARAESGAGRMEMLRWLSRRGAHGEVIGILSGGDAVRSRDELLIYLDAMAGLGRWGEVETLLARDGLPIEVSLRSLFRARAAQELGQGRMASLYWDQAQAQGAKDPAQLLFVAEYAERLGVWREAVKAYRRLSGEERYARTSYQALLRMAEAEQDTRKLRELMREVADRFPKDAEPRNDLAYLGLLLGEDVAMGRARAEVLMREQPELAMGRTLMALARLREGKPEEAWSAYAGLEIDWSLALPGWRAVRVAVLGRVGQGGQARELARGIPKDRLKPEERELIQPWL